VDVGVEFEGVGAAPDAPERDPEIHYRRAASFQHGKCGLSRFLQKAHARNCFSTDARETALTTQGALEADGKPLTKKALSPSYSNADELDHCCYAFLLVPELHEALGVKGLCCYLQRVPL
jgi:hypothetical protein